MALVAAAASVATIFYLFGGQAYVSKDESNTCQVQLRVTWGKTQVMSSSFSAGLTGWGAAPQAEASEWWYHSQGNKAARAVRVKSQYVSVSQESSHTFLSL